MNASFLTELTANWYCDIYIYIHTHTYTFSISSETDEYGNEYGIILKAFVQQEK